MFAQQTPNMQQLENAVKNLMFEKQRIEKECQMYSQTNPMYVNNQLMPRYNAILQELSRLEGIYRNYANNVNMFSQNAQFNSNNRSTVSFGSPTTMGFSLTQQNTDGPFGDANEDLLDNIDVPSSNANKTLASCVSGFDNNNQPNNIYQELEQTKQQLNKLMEENKAMEERLANVGIVDMNKVLVYSKGTPIIYDKNTGVDIVTNVESGVVTEYLVSDDQLKRRVVDGIKISEKVSEDTEEVIFNNGDSPVRNSLYETISSIVYGISTVGKNGENIFHTKDSTEVRNLFTVVTNHTNPGRVHLHEVISMLNKRMEEIYIELSSSRTLDRKLNFILKTLNRQGESSGVEELENLIKQFKQTVTDRITREFNVLWNKCLGKGVDILDGDLDVDTVTVIENNILGISEELCLTTEEINFINVAFTELLCDIFMYLRLSLNKIVSMNNIPEEGADESVSELPSRAIVDITELINVFCLYSANIDNMLNGDVEEASCVPYVVDNVTSNGYFEGKVSATSYPELTGIIDKCFTKTDRNAGTIVLTFFKPNGVIYTYKVYQGLIDRQDGKESCYYLTKI